MKATGEKLEEIGIRVPVVVVEALAAVAKRNRRSCNSQLIAELSASLASSDEGGPTVPFQRGAAARNMGVRLPTAVLEGLRRTAEAGGRSISAEIALRLTRRVHVVEEVPCVFDPTQIERSDILPALYFAVGESLAAGGGVVAIVAPPGYGKTVLAQQFGHWRRRVAKFFSPPFDNLRSVRLPDLDGVQVVIVDEPHRLANLADALRSTVGVIVLLCQHTEQVPVMAGPRPFRELQLQPWTTVRAAQSAGEMSRARVAA